MIDSTIADFIPQFQLLKKNILILTNADVCKTASVIYKLCYMIPNAHSVLL